MRAAGLGSLNTIQKYELEAQDLFFFFSPAMANTTLAMDTGVKHKRQAFSVLFQTSALTLKF